MTLDQPLVVVDLETTGTNFREDRIVEIAVQRIERDWTLGRHFVSLVHPGIPIPPEATAVHGITDAMVAKAPKFAAVAAGDLLSILDFRDQRGPLDRAMWAGFNALHFDVPLLVAEFERAGLSAETLQRPVVDACLIFKLVESRDLGAAIRFYGVDMQGDAHRAARDVQATVAVLKAQLDRYGPFLPPTVAELAQFCLGWKADWFDEDGVLLKKDGQLVMNKGKYKGRTLADIKAVDARYLRWMVGADFSATVRRAITEVLR